MPFAINESTEFISPTKTLEYMAAGKPIVSTPIHDVRAMFGDLVAIAGDAAAFVAACRAALAESASERAEREERMRARVREHSWDAAAAKIAEALAAAVAAGDARAASSGRATTLADEPASAQAALRKVASAG
jgi:UDP-galactopyranose mutase